jgi:regulator of RNase E activity RraB
MNRDSITKIVLMVAGIAVALMTVWLFQRRPALEQPAAVQQGIPDDEDGRVLQRLVSAGSDLSKPHTVEFFLYLPDQERATKTCDTLQNEGYTGKVQREAQGHQWKCLATKTLVPSHAEIVAISRHLEDLARMHGGSYDGWVTAVVQ